MNVRTFTLTDSNGNSYSLQTQNRFMSSPSGLGYDESTIYQNLGSRYNVLEEGLKQGVVSGQIVFRGANREEIYRKFFEFAKFTRNNPLTMCYRPIFDSFYRKCRVSKLTKTEINNRVLTCDVEISCITPWYQTMSAVNSGQAGAGKQYNYSYSYKYSDSILQSVVLENNSYEESPCKVIIYGPCVNPIWYHYVNGVLATTGKITATIAVNHRLVIDTTQMPYSMHELDMSNNLVRDCYQLSDFSTERFIRLQPGKNRITVTHSGGNVIAVGIEGQIEYATV